MSISPQKPGPQQRPPSTITKISFPSLGGLVFLRVTSFWLGNKIAPQPVARVEGLPWQPWNIFEDRQLEDEDAKKDAKVAAEPIRNPVTALMLRRYKYWPPRPNQKLNGTQTSPSFHIFVLDKASWNLVYAGHITSRQTAPMTRDEALAQFKGLIGSTGYEGLDPDKMGVGVFTNTFGEYTQSELEAIVAGGYGWTAHYEDTPGVTTTTHQEAALLLINLAKLHADLPKGINGKKPAQIVFKIFPQTYDPGTPGNRYEQQWKVEGVAYKSTITKTKDGSLDPQPDERLDYSPIAADIATPISGTSDYTHELNLPQWKTPTWFDASADSGGIWGAGAYAEVTITFGAAKKASKIEMQFVGAGTPPPIG